MFARELAGIWGYLSNPKMGRMDCGSTGETVEESYLSRLYTLQPLTLPDDVKEYVMNPKDVDAEVQYLEKYAGLSSPDLTRIVFLVEVVGKCLRKHSEFRDYMKVLTGIMERYADYQHSVFCLRIIKSVAGSKFYLPLSFYLIRILRNAMAARNITASGRKVDYDMITPSSERARSEEHQMFVIGEVNALLMQHMSAFSRNIGFPELAAAVTGELRKLRIGIYKEIVGDMMSIIDRQREYVLEKRNKLKLNGIDGKSISSFESSIERTLG